MKRTWLIFAALLLVACSSFAQQASNSATSQKEHAAPAAPARSADAIWNDLVAGNKRFMAGKAKSHNVVDLRRKLASGQSPEVIILSCSDSRVSPEIVFDQSLGDLFVVRTAGNIADRVGLGSIEYAVDHIHSPVLVVLGHQKCGAVTAACSGEKMPSVNLEAIVDKIGPAVDTAKKSAKGDELIESAIKQNVHQSAKDLMSNSEIINDAVKSGKLRIVEAEYELESGEVVRLQSQQ
jgi:carbonic anhydrase